MRKIIGCVLFGILLGTFGQWVAFGDGENVILVASPGVKQDAISSEAIRKIYLGEKPSWDDGSKVEAVTIEGGKIHDAFLSRFVKKTAQQYTSFWRQAIFAGEGIPPKKVPSEDKVVAFLAANPGSLGYISENTPHEGVKVLTLTDK